MRNHKLVVFGEHRSEDKTHADEDSSRDNQNARAICVKDLTDDCRQKELAEELVILCQRRIVNEGPYIPSGRVGLTQSS